MSSLALEDVSSVLVRVGGVLLLVLGIADIVKGLVMLIALSVLGGIAGGILSSVAPFFEFARWVLPLLGPLLGGSSLVVGTVAAVVGYSLLKLPAPLPAEQRNRWLLVTAILAAVALVFLSYWYLLAFAIILLGFLLSPTRLPPPPAVPQP
ncbi:MAG: hypothetical protein QXJ21_06785 [Thermofilum sp.]